MSGTGEALCKRKVLNITSVELRNVTTLQAMHVASAIICKSVPCIRCTLPCRAHSSVFCCAGSGDSGAMSAASLGAMRCSGC